MLDLMTTSAAAQGWRSPQAWWPALTSATAALSAPVAVIAQDALAYNARDMLVRARGVPIRVASKSIRVRAVLDAVLALPGYRGILAFTLAEALWLAGTHDDIVMGYPTTDRAALGRLLADERAAPALGHVGVRRSPLYSAADVAAFAARVASRPGFALVGVMMYEAQIAGQTDASGRQDGLMRWIKRQSGTELVERRGDIVTRVRGIADLEFVNGGGTGSLEYTAADNAVTELTAGSGFLAGTLFDDYQGFDPAPASAFAFDVVRKPTTDIATILGGGWIASGPPAASRQPRAAWPTGLRTLSREGAGEVQTPLRGRTARTLRVGDRVWMRHAKSGEGSERVASFHVVENGAVVDEIPTYRGEGKAFL